MEQEAYVKVDILENEIEAQLLDSILNERNIPHHIQSYHDTAYDGLFQAQKGWGCVKLSRVMVRRDKHNPVRNKTIG